MDRSASSGAKQVGGGSSTRNDDFPDSLGGPPSVQRLVIAVVDEATTKFAGLASGDLHVAGIAPSMASLVSRDPALRVLDYPVSFATALIFNSSRPPFDDVRVRRAVDALINRQRVIDVALAGYGVAGGRPRQRVASVVPAGEPPDDRAGRLAPRCGWLAIVRQRHRARVARNGSVSRCSPLAAATTRSNS